VTARHSQDPDFVLGPLATAGLVSLGWAAARRSPRALAVAVAALVLEANWAAYQRLKLDPRFQDLNLVTVWKNS
jgi:hypothetical protein